MSVVMLKDKIRKDKNGRIRRSSSQSYQVKEGLVRSIQEKMCLELETWVLDQGDDWNCQDGYSDHGCSLLIMKKNDLFGKTDRYIDQWTTILQVWVKNGWYVISDQRVMSPYNTSWLYEEDICSLDELIEIITTDYGPTSEDVMRQLGVCSLGSHRYVDGNKVFSIGNIKFTDPTDQKVMDEIRQKIKEEMTNE